MDRKEHKHQADELQKLFQEVQEHEEEAYDKIETEVKHDMQPKIDVLNLPPRKDVHRSHKKKTRFKLSNPLRRLILVVFILIIIIAIVYDQFADVRFIFN